MSVRLVVGTADGTDPAAVLFDSGSAEAFGPVFFDGDEGSGEERAEAFLGWLSSGAGEDKAREIDVTWHRDARGYAPADLMQMYGAWVKLLKALAEA